MSNDVDIELLVQKIRDDLYTRARPGCWLCPAYVPVDRDRVLQPLLCIECKSRQASSL